MMRSDARSRFAPSTWLAVGAVTVAIVVAYWGIGRNQFVLDDIHSIVENPTVRQLGNIPSYFRDPATFTTLPSNADYRPGLQTTYAVNYALARALHGDGYDPRAWHWFNMLLHGVCALSLFVLGRRLLGTRALRPLPWLDGRDGDGVAVLAAVLFAVHPIGTDCVNYISARSSLLVAALALPAMVMYLRSFAGPRGWGWRLGALGLYVVALFAKIEAIALVGVLVAAEVLLAPEAQELPFWRRFGRRAMWVHLAPFVAASVGYVLLWHAVSPLGSSPTAARAGMSRTVYFMTQVRGWWHYLGEIVSPDRLIADDPSYPVAGGQADPQDVALGVAPYSTLRALLDPTIWLALLGVLASAALACRALRPAPAIPFLAATFVVFLSPTSSVLPLAEMVNGHRPYLADAGIFLLVSLGLWLLVARLAPQPARTRWIVALALVAVLVGMTRARNRDWRDDYTLWHDTVEKVPSSARAQMSFGLALMARGRYAEAEDRFRHSAALWPDYDYVYLNLGVLLDAQDRHAEALAELDTAVRLSGSYSPLPYLWRAKSRAAYGDLEGMIADFRAAIAHNANAFEEAAGLAAGLTLAGRATEAAEVTARYDNADPAGFAQAREAMRQLYGSKQAHPASAAEAAEDLERRGLTELERGAYPAAAASFVEALTLDPRNHLAQVNLGIARGALGDRAGALAAFAAAIQLAPDEPAAYYFRARYFVGQGEAATALPDLQAAAAKPGAGAGESAALVECLTQLGQTAEADALLIRLRETGQADAVDRERTSYRANFRPR